MTARNGRVVSHKVVQALVLVVGYTNKQNSSIIKIINVTRPAPRRHTAKKTARSLAKTYRDCTTNERSGTQYMYSYNKLLKEI